mmetsp:Transcript_32955/g.57847  ORF Transcript_32955/g.57847 Transcript_32955/m.57847 type:complete len:177 (+) Transcript_32955:3537-4067(+)
MESAAARFECHICYELASAPVVTRCGHLFCWTCLHHWMQQNRATVTCPVCKGGISESSLIPLYTRGEGEDQLDDSNLPNRPNAEWQQPVPNQSYNPFEGFSRPLQSTQAESVTISAGYGFFPSLVTLIGVRYTPDCGLRRPPQRNTNYRYRGPEDAETDVSRSAWGNTRLPLLMLD